jgi:hypothetical protein
VAEKSPVMVSVLPEPIEPSSGLPFWNQVAPEYWLGTVKVIEPGISLLQFVMTAAVCEKVQCAYSIAIRNKPGFLPKVRLKPADREENFVICGRRFRLRGFTLSASRQKGKRYRKTAL